MTMHYTLPLDPDMFRNRLKAFVLRSVPSDQDAEDVVQDVFFKVYARLHTLQSADSLTAWVYQIVRNEIAEYHRRRSKYMANVVPLSEPISAMDTDEDTEIEAHQEIARCLASMVDTLPEQARQAIVLTEFEQRTQKEIAEHLGLSLSGAKSRVQRARATLKAKLLQCCRLEFDRIGNIIDYEPQQAKICETACHSC
jgi:RNA polymerase sigma-70 factor (ECF subfamily)